MKRLFTGILLIAALLISAGPLSAQEHLIKFATVAPEGSTWMKVMKEYDAEIRKESGGRLGFRIYPGGVQGDEKDVLRKMKLGQLQAAGVTGNGMTSIAPMARILDSPFLFRDRKEIDFAYGKFGPEIEKAMEEAGYVNLGWAEVGYVYIFTNTPINKREDFSKTKMWMWEGDPVAEASFKALGINPVPLSITDVLTSLQTKMIDGVYSPPLAAIALQWFTRVKYMFDLPLTNAAGAVIISKKAYAELPADLQKVLLDNGRKYMRKLTELSRTDNEAALVTLKKNGIVFTQPSGPDEIRAYGEIGRAARKMMAGKLYTADLLARMESALEEFRGPASGKK
jgi:TRAP-type C4-dicarboxylate transport system substrate-binding protein